MKKLTMFFCLLLFVGFINTTKSQVKENWVRRYTTNTGVIGADYDEAFAVDIDEQGYVYVTGSSFETVANGLDITTIKYSPNGTQEWLRSYNGPGNGHDRATVLTTDTQGNVYVAGYSPGPSGDVTLKYSSSGQLLWEARFKGVAVKAIETDVQGNVIVTGYGETAGSSFDIITIKYNSAGQQQWLSKYNGKGNYDDYPNAMTLDASGNIYIAGEVRESNGNGKNSVTLKYNSNGTQEWANEYGVEYFKDTANGIDVDNLGNVYVTGQGNTYEGDFVTIKYDPSGNQLWKQIFNGDRTYEGIAFLKVDNSGNVYVSGRSNGPQNAPDYATIKYNTDGVQQWISRYNGGDTDEVYSMAIDDNANIYMTGSSRGAIGRDYATVKYNSDGEFQWSIRYDNEVTHDEAYSIAVNSSGEVAVCGSSVGNGTGLDYAVVKYSSTPTDVSDNSGITSDFSLYQNYPNPFNPETTISYKIQSASNVSLKVYDVLGNEVATLVNEYLQAGSYNSQFSIRNYKLSSGVYFYKLQAGNFISTKKMVLMK